VLARAVPVLAGDQAAATQDRGADHDHAQGQRLAGQVRDPGPDVLAEQEHPEQAGRERVEDGESGLGGGQRPGGEGVGSQQHGRRPGGDEHVKRPGAEDGADAVIDV
jgi:hypothetical protein